VAPGDHTHDSRYYTESEIDSKLSGKADESGAVFTGEVGINGIFGQVPVLKMNAYSTAADQCPQLKLNNTSQFNFLGDETHSIDNGGDGVVRYNFLGGEVTTINAEIAIYGASGSPFPALFLTHNSSDGIIYTNVGDIYLNPAGHTVYIEGSEVATSSDIRFKKDIRTIENAIETIREIDACTFRYKKEEYPERNFPTDEQIGLIAQEVEDVFPEIVITDDKGYKSIAYSKLSVLLLAGIKEQEKKIEAQEREISNLHGELKRIKKVISSDYSVHTAR
jgi:hypothetical protein